MLKQAFEAGACQAFEKFAHGTGHGLIIDPGDLSVLPELALATARPAARTLPSVAGSGSRRVSSPLPSAPRIGGGGTSIGGGAFARLFRR